MSKGWYNQSYRHSLAARGIRTNMMGRHKDYHPSATSPHFVEDKTTLEGIYAFLDKPGNELLSDEVLAEELHDKFHGLTEGRAEALVERHRKSSLAAIELDDVLNSRKLARLQQQTPSFQEPEPEKVPFPEEFGKYREWLDSHTDLSDDNLAELMSYDLKLSEQEAGNIVGKYRRSLAVVGFSPEMKDRILRVLAQNPQLKSKIAASATDIVSGTTQGATGRAGNVSSWGQVWWITPEKRAGWEVAIAESERLRLSGATGKEIPEQLKKTIADIPGTWYEDKLRFMKHPERSQPWTIYLSAIMNTGRFIYDPRYKKLVAKYGGDTELAKDEYLKSLLEHETTHLAHGEKIPDYVQKMKQEKMNVWKELSRMGPPPKTTFKKAGLSTPFMDEAVYLSEPTEQLSRHHEVRNLPLGENELKFNIISEHVPKVVERRKVWEELLKASPKPRLRALPRKWQIGEGEEEYFSEVSPEEASVNLSYLE